MDGAHSKNVLADCKYGGWRGKHGGRFKNYGNECGMTNLLEEPFGQKLQTDGKYGVQTVSTILLELL